MINNYEVAEIVELGRAQDVVLGEKYPVDMDSKTLEFNHYNPVTDD